MVESEMSPSKVILMAALGLIIGFGTIAIVGCSQSPDSRPAENQQLSYIDQWLSKLPGYHFQGSTVTEGTHENNHAWIVDYQFLANNALGLPLRCHTTVYIMKDGWKGDAPKSYFEEEQAQQAKLMMTYQEDLVAEIETIALIEIEPPMLS